MERPKCCTALIAVKLNVLELREHSTTASDYSTDTDQAIQMTLTKLSEGVLNGDIGHTNMDGCNSRRHTGRPFKADIGSTTARLRLPGSVALSRTLTSIVPTEPLRSYIVRDWIYTIINNANEG